MISCYQYNKKQRWMQGLHISLLWSKMKKMCKYRRRNP